jgi:predicted ester cyclase
MDLSLTQLDQIGDYKMSHDLWAIAQTIDDAFHARDIEGIAKYWDDDIAYEAPGVSLIGKDARRLAEKVWFDAFPDARINVRSHLVDGDFLLIESTMTGTHTGPLSANGMTIPPTGRKMGGDYAVFLHFRAGKIVKQRIYFDRLKLMQDIGLIPGAEA